VARVVADHCQWRWLREFEASIPRDLRASDAWRERLAPSIIEQIRAEDPAFFARNEFQGEAEDASQPEQQSRMRLGA
jgi:hypothetical protein